jgi:hypothetical protein
MAKGHLVGTSAFSFDRARPFSFRQDEKKMGVHSAAKRHSPAPVRRTPGGRRGRIRRAAVSPTAFRLSALFCPGGQKFAQNFDHLTEMWNLPKF